MAADESYYWRVAPAYLEQLKRDSGFVDWQEIGDIGDPAQRLQRALDAAAKRHEGAPPRARVYSPEEALQRLVFYVAASIAISSRTLNAELMATLPPLLEPFAPLSLFAEAIWHNARALNEANTLAHNERARSRWVDVYEKLGQVTGADAIYASRIRVAVLFGIGALDVRMGRTSSVEWAERLAADPAQRVNGLYLRKVMALHVGDAVQAERYRKEAEVLALQTLDPQMFNATLPLELSAHALSGDLTGVRQVMARLRPLARTSAGWRAYAELAEGYFQQLRGDVGAAAAAFERCLAIVSPDADGSPRILVTWPLAVAGYVETQIEMGRYEEARAFAEAAFRECQALRVDFLSHEVARVLALAEAKRGEYSTAAAHLDAAIEARKALGVTGLGLGTLYEARARIAIWAGDEATLEKYANLAAKEYRHGHGSSLGARWERLMAEARRAPGRAAHQAGALELVTMRTGYRPISELVSQTLASASTREERAQRAVKLLCNDRGASLGHLYLVGDRDLGLAASYGGVAPPAGLFEYVRADLVDAMPTDSDTTVALTGTQVASLLTGGDRFRDVAGTEYQVALLTAPSGDAVRHVGAVAFVASSVAIARGWASLVSSVSNYLLRVGDTRDARWRLGGAADTSYDDVNVSRA
jgi:tetratricopeptide (TPR) repeat protein